jgi:putative tricarboxylic transport membrane protein
VETPKEEPLSDAADDPDRAEVTEDMSTPSQQVAAGRGSDRVLGLLSLAFGIWYVFETNNFAVTAFGTGPVGPKTLPRILGVIFIVMALGVIFKPDASPTWGSRVVWARLGAVVATSFLFGQIIDKVGFILASAALTVIIGSFFQGPLKKLVPLSLVFTTVVAYVFNNWLELHLPVGWWGGF